MNKREDNKVLCMDWTTNTVGLVAEYNMKPYHEALNDIIPKNLRDICSGITYKVKQ